MLYSDIWQFHKPGTTPTREAWDNGHFDAYDPPGTDIDSSERCSQACNEDDNCFQWKWAGGDDQRCTLLASIQHGKESEVKKEVKGGNGNARMITKAGWNENRIREWRENKECPKITWVGANVNRNI